MKRVNGLGGIIVKCKDKDTMLAWYNKHLQIGAEDWGVVFKPQEFIANQPGGYQIWSLAKMDSPYFEPSTAPFMINFTVEDLDNLLPILKSEGVEVIDNAEPSEYGKFAWILDPEGNKIELWEPPKQ